MRVERVERSQYARVMRALLLLLRCLAVETDRRESAVTAALVSREGEQRGRAKDAEGYSDLSWCCR